MLPDSLNTALFYTKEEPFKCLFV